MHRLKKCRLIYGIIISLFVLGRVDAVICESINESDKNEGNGKSQFISEVIGKKVKVELNDSTIVEGKIKGISDNNMVIITEKGVERISVKEIKKMELVQRFGIVKHVLWGFWITGLFSLLFFAIDLSS